MTEHDIREIVKEEVAKQLKTISEITEKTMSGMMLKALKSIKIDNKQVEKSTTQSDNQKSSQNKKENEVEELIQRFVSDCKSKGFYLSCAQVEFLKRLLSETSGRDHRNEQHQKPLLPENEDVRKVFDNILESIDSLCFHQTHLDVGKRI